jgi:hypothetical protein
MPSSSSFHSKANANRGRACRVEGCFIGRKAVSPWCNAHSKSADRYGHPLGRAVRPKEYTIERTLVEQFIAAHADHAGIQSALKWLRKWLDAANMSEDVPGRAEMQRLHAHAVEPHSILVQAAALFLLARWSPRKLVDDVRLDYSIGIAVIRLAPLTKRYGTLKGQPRVYSKAPGRVARREVGRRIRLNLAPLLMNISEAISEAENAKKQFDRDLRLPFKNQAVREKVTSNEQQR